MRKCTVFGHVDLALWQVKTARPEEGVAMIYVLPCCVTFSANHAHVNHDVVFCALLLLYIEKQIVSATIFMKNYGSRNDSSTKFTYIVLGSYRVTCVNHF